MNAVEAVQQLGEIKIIVDAMLENLQTAVSNPALDMKLKKIGGNLERAGTRLVGLGQALQE